MNKAQAILPNTKTETLNHALKILNEASETSADEIRSMIEHDFLKFKQLLSSDRPRMSDVLTDIQQATAKSLKETKETAKRIDEVAHRNPWFFVGIAIVVSSLTGYLFAKK
ncbi:MAG: hypothetical protein HYV97_20005 [Bdellovibrio sp.]|nr:hypothetical protein [Bdellovibrio sp.]